MSTIERLVPRGEDCSVDDLLRPFREQAAAERPFSDAALAIAESVSRRLATNAEARRHPALQALAFWIRRAALMRLREAYDRRAEDGVVRVPRGTVFHLPPANVDTIFVYSWLLALLAGNRSIVRVSARGGEQVHLLVRVIGETLDEHRGAPLARGTALIRYGHDAAITTALSASCDVRVIWGGDESVRAIRAVPLPPRAIELAFPDRFSFAAARAGAVLALSSESLADLAGRLFNDTYWFDQMGCSSPRVLVWVGTDAACAQAADRLMGALSERIVEARYAVDVGTALAKRTFAFGEVLDHGVSRVDWRSNQLTLLTQPDILAIGRSHPGGGLLTQVMATSLDALGPVLEARDQTLAHFGFSQSELVEFVESLGARAFDRLVPIGEALQFHRIWDGHDLLAEFTRPVLVSGGSVA